MASRFETKIANQRIFGIGDQALLESPAIAICGARVPKHDIALTIKAILECCKAKNVIVASTVNRGCDLASLRLALDERIPTIAITACAPDLIWPANASDILLEADCVISMEKWGTDPTKLALSRADMLLATLARACIIVEAPLTCESLKVAYSAKQTWAVMGNLFDRHMAGSNSLIENGTAIPLTSMERLNRLMGALSANIADSAKPSSRSTGHVIDEPMNRPWTHEEILKAHATKSTETRKRMRTPNLH
jgi:predicted Rossmann fold nucleotide-binding protein DprA/Smf involved in DNA uptake